MDGDRFIHLHVHSEYSLLDGAIRIPKLLDRTKAMGMSAVAITDHGNMHGAEEFSYLSQKMGINGIIGCEFYITERRANDGKRLPIHHLVLLAKDEKGYRNLCKLNTIAYFANNQPKPTISRDDLKDHSDGLIALSGCLKGEIASKILHEEVDSAVRLAEEYARIFPDRFYLEVMSNGIKEQDIVNRELASIGKRLGLPLVATNDCHYLEKEEAKAHDVLLCIQTHKMMDDKNRLKFQTDEFYFKSSAKMIKDFSWAPEAISNSYLIADSCHVELKSKGHRFPPFDPPEGASQFEYLSKLAVKGLAKRLNRKGGVDPDMWKLYHERLRHELEVIRKTEFATYFLIVWDIVNFARENGIVVGPGRGSAAGSLVAYALGITDIDPIPFNLLFERFLNDERISLPDIDIDISHQDRKEVINYLTRKYGERRVAHIGTFLVIKARLAIKDAGRVLNIPFTETDRISKLIPTGTTETILLEDVISKETRLKEMMERDPKIRELFDIAVQVQGLVRNASIHAAGVVISDEDLDNLVPLFRGKENEVITQYEMKSIERLGLIKFDILAIKTLTLIKETIDLVKKKEGIDICIENIPFDDPKVFKMISSGQTAGIFQMESTGMVNLAKKLQPEKIADLADLIALYRPGPLGTGLVENFIKRKKGEEEIVYDHPLMEEILKETYGIMLYQEQVMRLAVRLAGFSMTKADILRRAMGKKIKKEMLQLRKEFVDGCSSRGIPEKVAENIYTNISKFAEYGFNKSHSVAYAYVSYITAYLKTNYPVYFMSALLSLNVTKPEKVIRYINECKNMGIEILPPDVNESEFNFTPIKGGIRFGLSGIANLGKAAYNTIEEERNKRPFSSYYNFLSRIDLSKVNKRVVESLIKAGAFDSCGDKREGCWEMREIWMEEIIKKKKGSRFGQISIFQPLDEESEDEKDKRPPSVTMWTEAERIMYEKEVTGFYITGHPMEIYGKNYKKFVDYDIHELLSMVSNGEDEEGLEEEGRDEVRELSDVTICGIVSSKKEITTKKKTIMAEIVLEDLTGRVEVSVFSDLYEKTADLLKGNKPLIVQGNAELGARIIRIVAKDIKPLEEVRISKVSKIGIKLVSPEDMEKEKLLRLKELLLKNSGNTKVYVNIRVMDEYEVNFILHPRYRVKVDDFFIDSMMNIFGRDVLSMG